MTLRIVAPTATPFERLGPQFGATACSTGADAGGWTSADEVDGGWPAAFDLAGDDKEWRRVELRVRRTNAPGVAHVVFKVEVAPDDQEARSAAEADHG